MWLWASHLIHQNLKAFNFPQLPALKHCAEAKGNARIPVKLCCRWEALSKHKLWNTIGPHDLMQGSWGLVMSSWVSEMAGTFPVTDYIIHYPQFLAPCSVPPLYMWDLRRLGTMLRASTVTSVLVFTAVGKLLQEQNRTPHAIIIMENFTIFHCI